MNRYMVVAVLMIVPLYGMRKASEELAQSLLQKKSAPAQVASGKVTIASNLVAPEPQLIKSED